MHVLRVRAGISYALTEAMDEGHCGLPVEELMPLAERLLRVPQEHIRTALDLELQEGSVVADRVGETPCVFLGGLHRAERTIAERLMRLANGPSGGASRPTASLGGYLLSRWLAGCFHTRQRSARIGRSVENCKVGWNCI